MLNSHSIINEEDSSLLVNEKTEDDSDLELDREQSSEISVIIPPPVKYEPIEPKPFKLDHDQNDCVFHPAPAQVFLPSGYLRDKMENSNESPAQTDKQRRNEQRFLNSEKALNRPDVCVDHQFCIGNVPESPKESNIPYGNNLSLSKTTETSAAQQSLTFGKIDVGISSQGLQQQHQFAPVIEQHEQYIHVTDNDDSATNTAVADEQKMMQVSFNLARQMTASGNNENSLHAGHHNRLPSGATVQKDLSFSFIPQQNNEHASRQKPPIDSDLSGIATTFMAFQDQFQSNSNNRRETTTSNNLEDTSKSFIKENTLVTQLTQQIGMNDKSNALDVVSPCRQARVNDEVQLNPWEKVVVTQEGIDNWRAQLYGLNVQNFPKIKPEGMSAELFNELKKKYVIPTKMKVKKSIEDEENQQKGVEVKSRYMEWWNKGRPTSHNPIMKLQNQNGRQHSPLSQIRQESVEHTAEDMTDTNSNLSNILGASSKTTQLMQMRQQQQIRQSNENNNINKVQVPQARSYKTNVFHKNSKVDNLLSVLEPTPEQQAKQDFKAAQLAALEKARIERKRKERNQKTKIALTAKQKVHAEKLFQTLRGSVSRKEIEKTAFKANQMSIRQDQSPNTQSTNQTPRQSISQGVLPKTHTQAAGVQHNRTSGYFNVGAKTRLEQGNQVDQNLYSSSAVNRPHSTINFRNNYYNQRDSSNNNNNSISTKQLQNKYGSDQFGRKSASQNKLQEKQFPQKHQGILNYGGSSFQNNSSQQTKKKSIYKVFGVKQSQIMMSRRTVSKRPLSSSYSYVQQPSKFVQQQQQNGNGGLLSDYRNVEKDKNTLTSSSSAKQMMMNQAASAAQLRQRPPMIPIPTQSNSNKKQTITLVNARSTATKIVLRNLNKYQRQQQTTEADSIANTRSSPVGGQMNKMLRDNSLSFLGQYINHPGSTNSSLVNNTDAAASAQQTNKIYQKNMKLQIKHNSLKTSEYMVADNSTADNFYKREGVYGSKESLLLKDFNPGESFEPATVTGFSKQEGTELALQTIVDNQIQSQEEQLRAKLSGVGKNGMTRRFVQNQYFSAGAQQHEIIPKNYLSSCREIDGSVKQESSKMGIESSLYQPFETFPHQEQVDNQSASDYSILKHVVDDTVKNQNQELHQDQDSQRQYQKKIGVKSLTHYQPVNAIFRDMQGEFKGYQQTKQEEDEKKNLTAAPANKPWNVDTNNQVSQKEKDRRLLQSYIGTKHQTVVNIQENESAANLYFSARALKQQENHRSQEIFNDEVSSTPSKQSTSSPYLKNMVATSSALGSQKSQATFAQARARTASQTNNDTDMDLDINDHLYEDSPKFDIQDMLKDESEDEDIQENFEINQHISQAIDLASSHKYRNEIKDNFYRFRNMTQEEKSEQLNLIRDADFWLTKGISMTTHNQLSTAVQCYKQTLLLNQNHYVAMHNIAVCYERLEKFSSALKWFQRASQIKPSMHFTFIGATVNFFKLGKYEKAEQFVRAAIKQVEKEKIEQYGSLDFDEPEDIEPDKRDQSNSFRATINDYNYILSLCLRKLRRFEEAGKLYCANSRFYKYPAQISLINSLFGLLLLPMVKDRRLIANELEIIMDNLQVYKEIHRPIKDPFLGHYYQKNWKMKYAQQAATELKHKSFFKRFHIQDIVKFLPKMKVRQHEANSVIFPDFDVCIILDGLVESKFHKFGDRLPIPLSKFSEGDILGFNEGDHGKTSHVETWSVCTSAVEAIWMLREDFDKLWYLQGKSQKKMLCQVVRMQKCFQNCSDLTVHLIAFELLKTKEFEPGTVIIPMNKRSYINNQHKKHLEPQTNAILKQVMKERESIDINGIDRRISSWQLMLSHIVGRAIKDEARKQMILLQAQVHKAHVLKHAATLDPRALMEHQAQPNMHEREGSVVQSLHHYDKIHRNGSLQMDNSMDLSTSTVKEEHFQLAGVFIIETGRCSIMNEDQHGNKKTISVIGRNDSFGGAEQIKIATLDYLGEIVAGCNMQSGPAGAADRIATCHYLSIDDIKRIPEFELKNFSEVIYNQNLPFMQIASRKKRIELDKMQFY